MFTRFIKWLQNTCFSEEPTPKNGCFLKIWKVAICNFQFVMKTEGLFLLHESFLKQSIEIYIFEVVFHFSLVTNQFHVQYESSKTVTKIIIPTHTCTCFCFRCTFGLVWGMCCQGMHTFHVLANSHSLQCGLVVLGQRLDLTALEVFSNLNHSMIPSTFTIASHVLLSLRVFWDLHLTCLWAMSVKFRRQDWWKVHQ